MFKTKIFQPLKKGDTLRAAYIGSDSSCVTMWERNSQLGRQEYAQVCTKIPNLSVSRYSTRGSTALHRIVLHDAGILAVPLATGRAVRIDAYENNSTEGLKAIGRNCQSLYVSVPGIGSFSVSEIGGLLSGGFTIQSDHSEYGRDVEPLTADKLRQYSRYEWADAKVMRFEDPAGEQLAALEAATLAAQTA